MSHYEHGPLFTTPPLYEQNATRGTIDLPAVTGAANRGGSCADPESGFLYVLSKTTPGMVTLTPLPAGIEIWPSVAGIRGTPLPYVPQGKIGPPSSILGVPMTCMIDGKQYVVLTLQGGQMGALAASSGTGPSAR